MTAISRIAKGTVFHERDYGYDETSTATTNPCYNPETGQWTIVGKVHSDGRMVDFLITEGYEHYGPMLSIPNQVQWIKVSHSLPTGGRVELVNRQGVTTTVDWTATSTAGDATIWRQL